MLIHVLGTRLIHDLERTGGTHHETRRKRLARENRKEEQQQLKGD